MNKVKLAVIISQGMILALGISLIFFVNKSQGLTKELNELTKRLEEVHPGYQKLSQEVSLLKSANADLLKENTAVKADRENLMVQVKTLLQERSRAAELAISLEKAKKELEVLSEEKKKLAEENKKYQEDAFKQSDEVKRIQAAQKSMIAKWENLKSVCDKAESTVKIKELNRKIGDLQKEKTAILSNVKRRDIEFGQLGQQKTKLGLENVSLQSQLKDCNQSLAEAVKKNKLMWQETQNLPKKVTELARQNKLLIAETAQMHYNLGVFYSKNKQYDRAAIEFEKVVELNPNNAYAHFNLGYIYAEYLINRPKAAKHFRYYLGLAKSDDKDMDWVKRYLLTWEAYDGQKLN